jgi:hypothetical protein
MSQYNKLKTLLNGPLVQDTLRTGSNTICNPPDKNTDIDIVILIDSHIEFKENIMAIPGAIDESNNLREYRETYRLGKYHLIVTRDYSMFKKLQWFTAFATKLNIRDKEDRHILCSLAINNSHIALDKLLSTLSF